MGLAGGSFFVKRMSRKTYWISVAILLAVTVVVYSLPVASSAGSGLSFVWLLLWAPRLHDFGRSAWLMLIPILIQMAIVAGGFAWGGDEFGKVLTGDIEGIPQDDPILVVSALVILGALAVQFGFTILIGVPAGDTHANRFGDPPKS